MFKLVSSGGNVTDPAVVNMRGSGTIWPGSVVEFSRTGGQGVTPASFASTVTNIFGVALDYVQGYCDETMVKVIPFAPGQIWEADCIETASTTSIGYRYGISQTRYDRCINNASIVDSTTATAVFRVIALASATTGSGKVLGYFRRGDDSGVPSIAYAVVNQDNAF